MGDTRGATLVIRCSDSDLIARIAYDRSEGGGLNLLRVVIDQMAERHGRGRGRDNSDSKNYSSSDAAIGTMMW